MSASLVTRLGASARIEWRHPPSPPGYVPTAEVVPFLVVSWPSGRTTEMRLSHEQAVALEGKAAS